MKQLILGGARSGKSRLAEQSAQALAHTSGATLHYVATALPFDDEMRERIAHHKKQRGAGWQEHECPRRLAALLLSLGRDDVVLVDCLTLWLNNSIFELGDDCRSQTIQPHQFVPTCASISGVILCVQSVIPAQIGDFFIVIIVPLDLAIDRGFMPANISGNFTN